MRRLAAFAAAVLAVCLANHPALAGKRVALIIGNSGYQNVTPLSNPANDATAITEMFRKASFDVVESRRDLKFQEMRLALRDFGDRARGADIAVIYFAGHGLEVDGINYAVPIDAILERDVDVQDEAIALNRMLLAAEPANQLRLVILDACRDNPFTKKMKRSLASRSAVSRGLVGVEANRPNTFIAFAAKEGATAADGDGSNSPFSTALLKHLTRPGLDIRKAFGYVRDDVISATGGQQEPYTTNSLGGNDVTLVPAPAPAAAAGNANADIRRDYELAERVGTREAWDFFLAANPAGFYADLARAQRNKLAAEAARIAATEKAHSAAEEQARLAAEGAKASEQAKAAAQSKAAEEARLAAEKTKQVEDIKLAVAEQAGLADDQRLAAEKARLEADKAKQPELTKTASVEPAAAKEDKPDADKRGSPAVASLAPSDQAKPDSPAPQDIPRLLQTELRRVGCKTGEIDGEWNASSRRALSSFNDNAGTKLDVKIASIDALDVVKAKPGRVCPLDCERGTRASGERCVKITCDSDEILGSNGSCRPRPPRVVTRQERRAPAASSGRGRCFAFNGRQVCE
jgi:uncharacterized caspase-like protein